MKRRLLLAASFGLFVAAACGGSSPEPTPGAAANTPALPGSPTSGAVPAGATPAANTAAFVFGAVPGKPVVYWIHTDW